MEEKMHNHVEVIPNVYVEIPTVGMVLHYYPNGKDAISAANAVDFVPAMVIQAVGTLGVNLSVHTANSDAPVVIRYTVQHKHEISETNPRPYWEWPPRV